MIQKKMKLAVSVLAMAAVLSACGGGGDAGTPKYQTLTKASAGEPSQSRITYAVDTYAINWGNIDSTANITIRVADTKGQPVAEGRRVTLITEGGTSVGGCVLSGISSATTTASAAISECSIAFKPLVSQPADGYVTLLAYMDGEEAYTDLDGNGAYSAGEPFFDTGTLFVDSDFDGVYDPGEFRIASPSTGASVCPAGPAYPVNLPELIRPVSEAGTCNGAWGKALINVQFELPESFSSTTTAQLVDFGGEPFIRSYSVSRSGVQVSAVAGTRVTLTSTTANCTLSLIQGEVPDNSVEPFFHGINRVGTCAGASGTLKVEVGSRVVETSITLP